MYGVFIVLPSYMLSLAFLNVIAKMFVLFAQQRAHTPHISHRPAR